MRIIDTHDFQRWALRPRPYAFIGAGASRMDVLGGAGAGVVMIAREADT